MMKFSLEKRRIGVDLINVCKYLKGGCKDYAVFSVVHNDKTRVNGHKPKDRRVHLNIRNTFFTLSMTKHWQKLSTVVVEFPSLD